MPWWKVGLIASIVLLVVMSLVAGGVLWYITAHPMGEVLDDARSEKAGEVVGMLLTGGLIAIWAFAYTRLRGRPGA